MIPSWWPLVLALPFLCGGLWAWWGAQGGLPGVLLGVPPAVLLISPTLSNVFSGGDACHPAHDPGAFLGVPLSLPMFFVNDPVSGAVLLIPSAASFVAAGYLAVGNMPVPPEAPRPRMGIRLCIRLAADELAVVGLVATTRP